METTTQVVKREATQSERFTSKVIAEFTGTNGSIALTAFQKRLVQNYFISIDQTLKLSEEKRMKKDEKYRDQLPITWSNINMESLATHVVSCARIGFDPALANQINMLPFKNNTTQKYDIVFIEGYRGKELMAMKYGREVPVDVVVELVYSTDKFMPFKKDKDHAVESYVFEITKPFERGAIVGGFYYHSFEKQEKNKLMFYSLAEIEKRKPAYASSEFWGGKKDKWENGKKVGTETVEGWQAEMLWKTIYRAAYSAITIDSQKIDDDYIKLSEHESQAESLNDTDKVATESKQTIAINANKQEMVMEEAEVISETTVNPQPEVKPEPELQGPGF